MTNVEWRMRSALVLHVRNSSFPIGHSAIGEERDNVQEDPGLQSW